MQQKYTRNPRGWNVGITSSQLHRRWLYYAFEEIVIGKTDHRMLWANFTYQSAPGFQPCKPSYTTPQRLTLQDPRVVKKYNKILLQEHARLRLNNRAFKLQKELLSGLKQHHRQEYKTIANLDFCARRQANK
jgi:hypothetical protein